HISGGHFNPAVTLAVWIRGRCATGDVIPYWIAQVLGAAVAAWAVHFIKMPNNVMALPIGWKAALLVEFLFTFALAWVVLNTATAKGTLDNSFYGLAIGMTVMTGAFAVGGVSGGAFNPAVAVGVAVMKLVHASDFWIHLVADFTGGTVAAFAFKVINPYDR